MSGPTELLVLRLGLVAIIFVFVAAVMLSLRGTLAGRRVGATPTHRSWWLVVSNPGESGLARGARFMLAGEMLVGRDGRAGVILPDPSVSARHARLTPADGGWRVHDLESTNGSFIEGRRVGARGATIRRGQRLTFGNVALQLESD